MKLSYTVLKTFQQCPFHYHLRYHRGLPSRPRPAAQSSRAVHGALHLFHRGLQRHHTEEVGRGSLATLLTHFRLRGQSAAAAHGAAGTRSERSADTLLGDIGGSFLFRIC